MKKALETPGVPCSREELSVVSPELKQILKAELTARRNRNEQERKLFDELIQGIEDMRAHREGKITLRTHTVQDFRRCRLMRA